MILFKVELLKDTKVTTKFYFGSHSGLDNAMRTWYAQGYICIVK